MAKIKYDIDAMKFMSLFESMTGAKLRDCIIAESMITFVVEENEIAKAIGRGGANIRKLESVLKKKIKVAEYSTDIAKFIQNLTYPAKVREVKADGRIVSIMAVDSYSRGLLIGRGAAVLRAYESIVKRYFDIDEIKVL